jgi:hypothetical protein
MQELNAVVHRMNSHGARVTDVVIEAMNFQKGLSRDERLIEMQKHYGFATREHLTGWNKYDENIGVASMVTSFVKQEIELPWALLEALLHYVGMRVYSGTNTDSMAASNNFTSKFELSCERFKLNGLQVQPELQNPNFDARGWR